MKKLTAYLWVAAAGIAVAACLYLLRGQFAGRADAKSGDASSAPASPFKVHGDEIEVPDAAVASAGIKMLTVKTDTLPVILSISGKTGLDMERVAHVHAQFGGKVIQVVPQLGDVVTGPETPGGPTQLCVIESADLAGAKSDYLKAQVQLKLDQDNLVRTQELVKSTVLAEKFLLDAQSAVTKDAADFDAARQRLKVFGLSDQEIQAVAGQQGRERMDYAITSPRSGVIAEKGVTGGEIADPTMNLFTVADTSRLWLWGDVYERDRPRLKEHQKVVVYLTSAPDVPHETTIDWISPVLDVNTRSIRVRAALDNKDGRLLAEMYATLLITVDDGRNSIVVPAEAVARKRGKAFVFVQAGNAGGMTIYQRRAVKVEPVDAGPGLSAAPPAQSSNDPTSASGAVEAVAQRLRVIEGLKPGEPIVRSGALGLFNEMESQEQ
jgi:cobalt-zinc-cadmium efflux system membrane fusion protein